MYNGRIGATANMDGLKPKRPARLPARGPAQYRPGSICRPARRNRSDGKAAERFGGGSVLEIIADHHGNTWRAVYTVRHSEAIYVLHAFQKKSKRGIATPKKDMDLIHHRLAEAERLHKERQN